MARYIDADKLWNDRPLIPEGKSQDYGAGFSECMWGFSKLIRKQIDNPAADVVPRTEIEKIFFELARKLNQMLPFKSSSFINGEPLGNSFDLGKEKTIYEILNFLAELEKKYAGGNNENTL